MKNYSNKSTFTSSVAALALVLPVLLALVNTQPVRAAALTQVMVRFDRMKISTPTTGTICAKTPAGNTDTEADVQVTFPTGYSLGAAGTFTISTTDLAWPSGAAAWPSIATATNVTGQVVTFPSGNLAANTLYCFNWTSSSAVSIKSSATSSNTGTVTTRTNAPATVDTAPYSTASISDDQITVSATVPSTFSFALSGNTDALGTLSTGSVATSPTPRTATINTNAGLGWMVWAKEGDLNPGLYSASASDAIAATTPGTNSTLSAGTEGYNMGITSTQAGGSGTITVAAAFVGTAAGQGGGIDTTLRTLASSNGTADTAVLTIKNNVAISGTTPAAADYTDTITIIGGGLF